MVYVPQGPFGAPIPNGFCGRFFGNSVRPLAGMCGGDYKAEEIVRLRRIEVLADAARFDADSIFFTDDFPLAEGGSRFRDLQVGVRAGVDGAARGAGVRATRHSPDETIKPLARLISGLLFPR